MSLPPSDFAATFRALVMPRLRAVIESRALLVALDLQTFARAHSDVMVEALRLGAAWLPRAHMDALCEWSQCALLDAESKAEGRVQAHTSAMVHIHVDIDRWETRLG